MPSVPVGSFVSRPMAELARSYLADQGIDAAVTGDDAGGTAPHTGHGTGGVYLLVAADDAPEARRLLHEADGRADADADAGPPRTSSERVTRIGRWVLALALAGLLVATMLTLLPPD